MKQCLYLFSVFILFRCFVVSESVHYYVFLEEANASIYHNYKAKESSPLNAKKQLFRKLVIFESSVALFFLIIQSGRSRQYSVNQVQVILAKKANKKKLKRRKKALFYKSKVNYETRILQ